MSEPSAEEMVKEAMNRYGEKRHRRRPATVDVEEDVDCRVSRDFLRQDREVADMVAKAYESDPNYEPVVTKVGANHWEVNELKPRRRHVGYEEQGNDKVVDTGNDAVDVEFQYRENRVIEEAIDPFFLATGDLPFQSERRSRDPWYGPVPGMERMFGPTFDHKNWY